MSDQEDIHVYYRRNCFIGQVNNTLCFFGKLTHALGVFSTSARQLLTDLGEGSLRYLGKSESLATSFRDVRCWYSASTPSCYMIVCRPLIARTDDHTHYITFSFFKSLGNISTEGLK